MTAHHGRTHRGSDITAEALLHASPEEPVSGPSITHISVSQLFGLFDYSIPEEHSLEAERLLILYGDNGSGKTTILELLHHLLSPAQRRGHRSQVAQVPFRRFQVRFSDGSVLTASRTEDIIGDFSVTLESESTVSLHIDLTADETGIIPPPQTPEEFDQQEQYTSAIRALGLVPYYLADDRKLYSDTLPEEEPPDPHELARGDPDWEYLPRGWRSSRRRPRSRTQRQDLELQKVLRDTAEWLSLRVYRASSTGSASANTIYLDVARRIARYGEGTQRPSSTSRESLHIDVSALMERNRLYEEFELTPAFPGDDLLQLIAEAPDQQLPLLDEVLRPYLNGLSARLDALQDIAQLISTFSSAINDFFRGKHLHYTPREGISINVDDGQALPPERLSSGERQLLLLLCGVLRAREQTRLFLIDEPELSLNVKWQRRLFEAILECSQGTGMQFIAATHSLEMVSGYSDNVARLFPE